MRRDVSTLLDEARLGDRAALARLLSLVERGGDGAREVEQAAHAACGQAYTVGMTGPPGAGKSTLTGRLLGVIRGRGDRVAVLAVDPSSPFSGGAILGDRIRMHEHATDDGVVIRSMATRGHLGGLALATPAAARVLDAAGWPWVLIETVGVGQVEVDVAGATDTTVVVLNPGWGDAVQAAKAGLLEVADVFAINKADRPGLAEAQRDLRSALALSGERDWQPPIVATVAEDGTGVDELWDAVGRHRSHLERTGGLQRRRAERVRTELAGLLAARLVERARDAAGGDRFAQLAEEVTARRLDIWSAADRLLEP